MSDDNDVDQSEPVEEGVSPMPDSAGEPFEAVSDQASTEQPERAQPEAADPVSVESLVAALEAVTAERDQHLSDLQRVSADFANFRKQTEKRNSEFAAQAGSRVGEALLPVLDACDAAAQQGVEGVEPIASQLYGILESSGLELITDESDPFDPNRHEAAMTEPADEGQDVAVVAQVLRPGYAWNGRVLRAAMVKVKG